MARSSYRRGIVTFGFALVVACARPVAPDAVSLPQAPTSQLDVLGASALAQRAEACFADPSCPIARAAEDFSSADARGAEVDCFRFYYGIGVPADAARARTCFARNARRDACDGSPDLPRLYLATMQIEGQGGERDRTGAETTLSGCARDVGVEGVLELRAAGHTDFCEDIGGTTLTMSECASLGHERATFALQAWRKSVDATLSPAARSALGTADAAFMQYVEADASREADAFRGGTLSGPTYAGARSDLVASRAAALAMTRASATDSDVAERERDLATATASARASLDDEGGALFTTSDRAFRAYLDAELAAAVQRGEASGPLRARLLRDRTERLR